MMFEYVLITQLQNTPCEGLYVPPNTMARVCQKTVERNSKNQLVYKMITTANPKQEIIVNRCTWQASPIGGYYEYIPESKWCI